MKELFIYPPFPSQLQSLDKIYVEGGQTNDIFRQADRRKSWLRVGLIMKRRKLLWTITKSKQNILQMLQCSNFQYAKSFLETF